MLQQAAAAKAIKCVPQSHFMCSLRSVVLVPVIYCTDDSDALRTKAYNPFVLSAVDFASSRERRLFSSSRYVLYLYIVQHIVAVML